MSAFEELATLDRVGRHGITHSAGDADLILFTEAHVVPNDWSRRAFREHPLRRSFPERCFAYDETDEPWCWLPGIYVSMPAKRLRRDYQIAGAYYKIEPPSLPELPPDLLFSFVGSIRSHRCREPIARLVHPRSIVEDTPGFVFFEPTSDQFEERRQRFAQIVSRSKFVLCPRGRGSSSIRLYETLAAGRVPVIVSDEWAPPPGPRWQECSVRVKEADISGIPRRLEALEKQWPSLSAAAMQAYTEWFAPDVSFHRIVESCLTLSAREAPASFPARGIRNRSFFAVAASAARSRTRQGAVSARNRAQARLAGTRRP